MTAPEVRTAADLADLRLWLAEQWRPERPFGRVASGYLATESLDPRIPVPIGSRRTYAEYERSTLREASLWWVSESMVDLLLACAASIPDDVTIPDLPKMPTRGLVVFEKPWLGVDSKSTEPVAVDAVSWGIANLPPAPAIGRPKMESSLAVSSYRRYDFDAGLTGPELDHAAEVGAFAHATERPVETPIESLRYLTERAHDPVAPKLDPGSEVVATSRPEDENVTFSGTYAAAIDDGSQVSLHGQTWAPLGRSDWPISSRLGTPTWPTDTDELTQAWLSAKEDRQILAAFFTLIHQQGIAQRTVQKADRPTTRRSQRAGVPKPLADVQVITLRKLDRTETEPDGDETTKREWSHRWLVSGHWRLAQVGKRGSGERRLTFVRPYVKGPESKPLRVPTRVNAWTR